MLTVSADKLITAGTGKDKYPSRLESMAAIH